MREPISPERENWEAKERHKAVEKFIEYIVIWSFSIAFGSMIAVFAALNIYVRLYR